ncbi:Endoribonuclease L-PSP/chorismate mutase-like protein [Filobasidium floriforme]|uniref:Endoribonuclease L-PSP/chorismate mutase-like protein n=1 Tax=Filobasidium floriforme TaxID=5210 RepID=UPI001E8E3E9C|nr:Endoribonuclease L-PSP/chorismate mutase-like protein [Filobasidium floriforme]KAH8081793.1 Endoribonuclease L-PSP/chorismate mutase-like protein [Filobasidium floriforme]
MSAAPYTVVATDNAPKAIGPYVQAVKHNGIIYASGSVPFIPETMEIIEGGIEAQAEQMFKNVKAVMDGSNTDASHVLKTTVFLKDMGDFAKFNAIYEKFYSPYKPARSCVEVARLPKDVLCELEFIAIEKK